MRLTKFTFRTTETTMDAEKRNGRPRLCPEQDSALERYTLRLSFKDARLARKIGGGNFSEGIRAALQKAAEDIDWINRKGKK